MFIKAYVKKSLNGVILEILLAKKYDIIFAPVGINSGIIERAYLFLDRKEKTTKQNIIEKITMLSSITFILLYHLNDSSKIIPAPSESSHTAKNT